MISAIRSSLSGTTFSRIRRVNLTGSIRSAVPSQLLPTVRIERVGEGGGFFRFLASATGDKTRAATSRHAPARRAIGDMRSIESRRANTGVTPRGVINGAFGAGRAYDGSCAGRW